MAETATNINEPESVWILLEKLFPAETPEKNKATYWSKILKDRETFQDNKKHASAFTLGDISKSLDSLPDKKLNALSVDGIDQFDFINLLTTHLQKNNLQKYYNECSILPNQNYILKKHGELQQELYNTDEEIGDELKSIGKKLNIDIKGKLLHERIILNSENYRLQELKGSTVQAQLLQKIKATQFENADEQIKQSSVDLFNWLVNAGKFSELAGYPVLMESQKWEKLQLLKEPFLAPVSIWKAPFQKYKDLFQTDLILAEIYAVILSNSEIIKKITDQGWLLKEPLYYRYDDAVSGDLIMLATTRTDKDKLSQTETSEWKMTQEIKFSQLANLNSPKDKNIIDKSRSAAKRTTQLLEFIIEVLLTEDTYGFTRTPVKAVNGSQHLDIGIYPSKWLLDLKRREWVRDKSTNSSSKPTVEVILPYFSNQQEESYLYDSLQSSLVSRFIHFLGIGVGDLIRNIRAGENEEEGISWDRSYVTILMNKSLTPDKVTALLGDPEFINSYEEKKKADERRRQNQQIGTSVEKAFETAFGNGSEFSVKREPIGSDYILESDFEHYLLISSKTTNRFWIEIKSTRSTEVKMTITQGITAFAKKENYILCVVPLTGEDITPDDIINNARFVTNIASLLEGRVNKIKEISILQKDVTQLADINSEKVWASIEGTDVRFVISQRAWQDQYPVVLTYEQFKSGLIADKTNS